MTERNIDARVAVLEEIAATSKQTLQEIRADIRDLRNDLRADTREVQEDVSDLRREIDRRFDRLDGEMWRNSRWLLVMLSGFVGMLGVLAHGFHWL